MMLHAAELPTVVEGLRFAASTSGEERKGGGEREARFAQWHAKLLIPTSTHTFLKIT